MPIKPPRIFKPYWDSCVLISAIQRDENRVEILDKLKKLAVNGQMMVVTSSIATAEVIKVNDLKKCGLVASDEDPSKIEKELETIKDYLENPWITRRIVDATIAGKAASLRRRFKLKLADAIHLATAWHYEVDQLQTYDTDLLKLHGEISLEKKGTKLKICNPEVPTDKQSSLHGQMSFFSETESGERE